MRMNMNTESIEKSTGRSMHMVSIHLFKKSSFILFLSAGYVGACVHAPTTDPAAQTPQAADPGVPQPIPHHSGEIDDSMHAEGRDMIDQDDQRFDEHDLDRNDWGTGTMGDEQEIDTDTGIYEEEYTVDQQARYDSDVEITREIRRAIIDGEDFSIYARNVTIDTQDGQVTLIGLVRSPDEKRRIEEIASQIAGSDNVTSEIVIDAH
jgi:hypothetical protein